MNDFFFGFQGQLLLISAMSFVVTGIFRSYALSRLMDVPNARSSHFRPTPRGGGFGVMVALTAGLFFIYAEGHLPDSLAFALVGLLPLSSVGFLDDHYDVPAKWRFVVQILVSGTSLWVLGGSRVLVIGDVGVDLGVLALPLGVLFVVWFLNLFNFMDGIDGLEAVEVIFILSAAAFLSMQPVGGAILDPLARVALMAAAAISGFLVWNWPPARIFMGDVGSGSLGFLVAILALYSASNKGPSLCVWLILAGIFVVDATLTLLMRIFLGERWFEAHRSHAYQHAALRYKSHGRVTAAVIVMNLFWLSPCAFFATLHPEVELVVLGVAWLPLFFLAMHFKAGRRWREAL